MTHGWPGSDPGIYAGDRSAHRPDRVRRKRWRRVSRRDPFDAGIWIFRKAGRARLGRRSHRARLGRADARSRHTNASLHRAAIGVPASRRSWRSRRLPGCSGSTSICPQAYRPTLRSRCSAGARPRRDLSADERAAYGQLTVLYAKKRAYALMMGTRPQTLYGLADSPVSLASGSSITATATINPPPHSYRPSSATRSTGTPAGALTRDALLDDITLYWLTNTGVSSGRLYWETKTSLYNSADVALPSAVSVFPGENYQAPRSWCERSYQNLIYYNRIAAGGHFAAWEQPQIFSEEVRAGLRSLRAKPT